MFMELCIEKIPSLIYRFVGNNPAFITYIDKYGIAVLLVTKSISRFGRNAEDILMNTKAIKDAGGVVYFQEQGFASSSPENELYISIYAAVAESESEAISSNIRWGIKKIIGGGSVVSLFSILSFELFQFSCLISNRTSRSRKPLIYKGK